MVPQKGTHEVTMGPGNVTPRYIPKRTENMCPRKNLYVNVHSGVTHTCQKVETTKRPSAAEQIRNMWWVYTVEYYLAVKRNETLFTCVEETQTHRAK